MTNSSFTSQNALELSGVTKSYDSFTLKDVSFVLPSGSIMGFIGKNGAGKSTTIKAILGLIQKDKGMIRILGLDPEVKEAEIKEEIGVVFDECHFHDTLTPKLIGIFMKDIYKRWDSALYDSLLRRYGLSGKKTVNQLSRGMKMKLSIACALSHHPKLLILDEATSGLDPVVRNEILDEFLDFIQDETHSILLSSHITSDLDKIADYITLIHEGKILFSKSKDALCEAHSILRLRKEDLPKIDPADIVHAFTNHFGTDVLVKVGVHDPKYASFSRDRVTLEDLMLFYTKEDAR